MPALISGRAAAAAAFLLVATAAGCNNAGESLGLAVERTSAVSVAVYLDRDGSRTLTVLDTVFAKARIGLLLRGSLDTLRAVASSAQGVARFDAVPVGQYRVAVVTSSIGDSLEVSAIDSTNIRIVASDTNRVVLVRLGYPEVTIRQARALPQGRRVFIRGVILAGVQSFRDATSHVSDSSGQIRMTRVVLRGGLVGNNPGDSVSVLGAVSSLAGQPTLDQATVSRFASVPAPIPYFLTTAVAATANSGVLDAALVQVTAAIISATASLAPDFQVTASDGSGSLHILLDANLSLPQNAFAVGRSMNVRGVLVPDGVGGWNLKPRGGGDIVFN
jgi:hypothetical protein